MNNLPRFIVDALLYSDYTKDEDSIGVTTLIDSPRIRKLLYQHANTLLIDDNPLSNVDAMLGSAIHAWIAATNTDQSAIVEQRLSAHMVYNDVGDTVVISGQPDRVEPDTRTLYDLKTTKASSVMYGIKPSWVQQTNVYRWLLWHNNIDVDYIKIVVIYKDWSVGERQRMLQSDYSYPDQHIEVIDIPVWDMAATHEFVRERVLAHTTAELPLCTPEERWERPAKFAVHKGRKYRAERVLDTMDEALEWCRNNNITAHRVTEERVNDEYGYYIVRRPEVWVRCADYCPVASVCEQYQSFVAEHA